STRSQFQPRWHARLIFCKFKKGPRLTVRTLLSSQNPFEPLPPVEPVPATVVAPISQQIAGAEDPPFTGWDVLVLVGVSIGAIALLGALVVIVAQRVLYPQLSLGDVAQNTSLALVTQ